LRAKDIEDWLEAAIAAWYELHAKVRTALDAISAVDGAPFVFVETRFMNCAGAAEQVHAALVGGQQPRKTGEGRPNT
jgi:hypothetical protein